jgi:hypothetical protein
MSLSDALLYAPTPSAVSSSAIRNTSLPVSGSIFKEQDEISFHIPCGRRGQYLMPEQTYLKFDVVNADTQAFYLDHSGHSLISRVQVFHGSNLLEDISDYNALMAIIYDATVSENTRKNTPSISQGCTYINRCGAIVTGNNSRTLCLPLMSGILGTLARKALPTGAMVGDLRVVLTLCKKFEGIVYQTGDTTTGCDWSVQRPELITQMVQLDPEVDQMVRQATSGRFVIANETWRSFSHVVTAGSVNTTALIPARYTSVNTLWCMFRPQADLNTDKKRSTCNRVNPDFTSAQIRVGSVQVPQKPIVGSIETFYEFQKSLHAPGSTAPGSFENYYWDVTNPTSEQGNVGGQFVFGLDLTSFSGKSGMLESGINTISQNVLTDFTYSTGLAADMLMNTFVNHDSYLIVEDGLATSRF